MELETSLVALSHYVVNNIKKEKGSAPNLDGLYFVTTLALPVPLCALHHLHMEAVKRLLVVVTLHHLPLSMLLPWREAGAQLALAAWPHGQCTRCICVCHTSPHTACKPLAYSC